MRLWFRPLNPRHGLAVSRLGPRVAVDLDRGCERVARTLHGRRLSATPIKVQRGCSE